jgi:hypothetical protein
MLNCDIMACLGTCFGTKRGVTPFYDAKYFQRIIKADVTNTGAIDNYQLFLNPPSLITPVFNDLIYLSIIAGAMYVFNHKSTCNHDVAIVVLVQRHHQI